MSWMLVVVIMMGSVGALIITVLYVKTLREKRASQVCVNFIFYFFKLTLFVVGLKIYVMWQGYSTPPSSKHPIFLLFR